MERDNSRLSDPAFPASGSGSSGRNFKIYPPHRTSVWIRILYAGIVVTAAAIAAVYMVISLLPYNFLHAMATRGAGGKISFFTLAFYQAMRGRLGIIAAICAGFVVLLLLFRRQTLRRIALIHQDIPEFLNDARSATLGTPRSDFIFLAYFVGLAFALRLPLLFQPMRYDEASTFVEYACRPLYVVLSFYSSPNNHLLHTLLVHLAYLLFGAHEWALRLPTFAAGIGLVPASYFAARLLYIRGAVIAAGLTACSTLLIDYSTNARGYSMLALCFLLILSLGGYIVRKRNWAALCLLALITALGFYTIPIMLYPCGGLVLWMFLSSREPGTSYSREVFEELGFFLTLTAVISFLLYSPVFAVSGLRAVVANKFVAAQPIHEFVHKMPASLLQTWLQWNWGFSRPVAWVLALSVLAGLVWHQRCSRFRIPFLFALLAAVVPILLVQRVVPFERVWLFALPLYFIIAAAGLSVLVSKISFGHNTGYILALLIAAFATWTGIRGLSDHSVLATNEGRGIEAVAQYLKTASGPDDSVVTALESDGPLRYYMQLEGVPVSRIAAPSKNRTFVVVNEITHDSLRNVLHQNRLDIASSSSAKMLARYDTVQLYEIPPSGALKQ